MKCLIIDKVHESIGQELSKYMTVEEKLFLKHEELKACIGDVDLLIMRVDPRIDKEILDEAKNLKAIGVCSVGTDHIDGACAKEKGIKIYNAPGMNANAVAELTISKLLDISRNVIPAHLDVTKNHEWDKYRFVGRELRDHTLGILGFGRIGRRVCEIARVFKMNVVAYDPFLKLEDFEKAGAKGLSIDELLKEADYITIHLPYTNETANLINKKTIAAMKDGSVVLNMARGGIVNEQDMYEALKSGKLGGYAADVMEKEHDENVINGQEKLVSPLFELDNFIITPHLGAQTTNAFKDIADLILKEVKEEFKLG